MAKKLTVNQELWQKELNRIKRFQKSATKRGFYFPDEIIPDTPRRITKKALERLQKMTPNQQYAKAVYLDKASGKMISGTEGRTKERSIASKKGWEKVKLRGQPRPKDYLKDIGSHEIDPDTGEIITQPRNETGFEGGLGLESSVVSSLTRMLENLQIANYEVEQGRDWIRSSLLSIWKQTVSNFQGRMHELEDYIREIDLELQYCLDTIQYDSDGNANGENVKQAISTLERLLRYNAPSQIDDLKRIESDYTDMNDTDNDLPYERY